MKKTMLEMTRKLWKLEKKKYLRMKKNKNTTKPAAIVTKLNATK